MKGFSSEGALNPDATHAVVSTLTALVLVDAGELDTAPTLAAVTAGRHSTPNSTMTVQPGGGHFPWLDDPAFCTAAIRSFLA